MNGRTAERDRWSKAQIIMTGFGVAAGLAIPILLYCFGSQATDQQAKETILVLKQQKSMEVEQRNLDRVMFLMRSSASSS